MGNVLSSVAEVDDVDDGEVVNGESAAEFFILLRVPSSFPQAEPRESHYIKTV